jgi:hypothetical protein
LLPAGAMAEWDWHPLKSAALPRRTPEEDVGTDSRFGRTAFGFSHELVHFAMVW